MISKMAIGRLERIDFLQDDEDDRLLIFPKGYLDRKDIDDADIISVSTIYPTRLSLFGTESYSLFSSNIIEHRRVRNIVEAGEGPLSLTHHNHLLDVTSEETGFIGLSLSNQELMVIYPNVEVDSLRPTDLILLGGRGYRAGIIRDYECRLEFRTACDFEYTRSPLLGIDYDAERHNTYTEREFNVLKSVYQERLKSIRDSMDMARIANEAEV